MRCRSERRSRRGHGRARRSRSCASRLCPGNRGRRAGHGKPIPPSAHGGAQSRARKELGAIGARTRGARRPTRGSARRVAGGAAIVAVASSAEFCRTGTGPFVYRLLAGSGGGEGIVRSGLRVRRGPIADTSGLRRGLVDSALARRGCAADGAHGPIYHVPPRHELPDADLDEGARVSGRRRIRAWYARVATLAALMYPVRTNWRRATAFRGWC